MVSAAVAAVPAAFQGAFGTIPLQAVCRRRTQGISGVLTQENRIQPMRETGETPHEARALTIYSAAISPFGC